MSAVPRTWAWVLVDLRFQSQSWGRELSPEIHRFPGDYKTPLKRQPPGSRATHPFLHPPPLTSARSPSLRDDANRWGGRAAGKGGERWIASKGGREGVGGGGGGEGAQRPFKAIAIPALSPVLGCWRARAASQGTGSASWCAGQRSHSARCQRLADALGTPPPSPAAPPRSPPPSVPTEVPGLPPKELTSRSPDLGEPTSIPSSAAAAATAAASGAAWSSWGSCSAS